MLLRVWKPEGPPRAVVVGFHGLGSQSGLLEFMASQFTSKGFIFYAPDLRGFGTYPGKKGHVDSYDEYDEDLNLLIEQIREGHPDEKMFLYGHSLGSVHAVRYLFKYPNASVDGLILPSPGVSEKLKVSGAIRAIGALLSKFNIKTYIDNGLDLTLLAQNPEVIKLNLEDPLRFEKVTPRYAIEGLKASKDTFESAYRIKHPVLVQQPGRDLIVVPEENKEFYDKISSEDKTWKLYPDLYHQLYEDEGGEKVLADMFTWIEERL